MEKNNILCVLCGFQSNYLSDIVDFPLSHNVGEGIGVRVNSFFLYYSPFIIHNLLFIASQLLKSESSYQSGCQRGYCQSCGTVPTLTGAPPRS